MKSTVLKLMQVCGCFLVLISTSVFAQHSPILGSFSASQDNGKVYLEWQIISGSTCNGIRIFRSTDNINFAIIGDIPGLCGDISSPVSYDFTDYSPVKNNINYYRLELGSSGYSEILSLEIIDIENSGYQIRPNPVSNYSRIYFKNSTNQLRHLSLFGSNGSSLGTYSTKNDFFDIDARDFQNGIYFFSILDDQEAVKTKGKLMIQH